MFKNVFLTPLGSLIIFLLGIVINVILYVPSEGLWRLLPLVPSIAHLIYLMVRKK